MYLFRTAGNVSAAYDGIAELFEKIEDFTSRLKMHTQQDVSHGMRKILVEILIALLDTLALSAKRLRDGRISRSPSSLVSVLADVKNRKIS